MPNASLAFGFLTQSSSLGELCILHIQNRWEMRLRGIVKNYTADMILRTKFKKIIGMKEKISQNMEVAVSLVELLLQTQGSFGGFFCLKFYILRCFLGEQDFQSSFFGFLADNIKNSNVFVRMCFRTCFRECISENVFLICFQ